MKQYPQAGREYQRYLQLVNQGEYASHAVSRLKQWQAKGLL
jgi:hypothetical protein